MIIFFFFKDYYNRQGHRVRIPHVKTKMDRSATRQHGITIQVNGYNFRRRYQTSKYVYWYCRTKGYVQNKKSSVNFMQFLNQIQYYFL